MEGCGGGGASEDLMMPILTRAGFRDAVFVDQDKAATNSEIIWIGC